jgi:hypothetical protein
MPTIGRPSSLAILLLSALGASCAALAALAEPSAVGLAVNGQASEVPQPALVVEGQLLVAGTVLAAELGLTLESSTSGSWTLRAYGRRITLAPGDRRFRDDAGERTAAVAPLYRGDELYVPVAMLSSIVELTVTRGAPWSLRTAPTRVLGIRQGVHPDKCRFVVDLAQPVSFRLHEEPGKVTIEFPVLPEGDRPGQSLRLYSYADQLAPQVTETVQEGVCRLVFSHYSVRPPEVLTLGDPPRLVLDLCRETPPEIAKPPAPPQPAGPWRALALAGSRGPVRGFTLQVSLGSGEYTWRPALANGTVTRRARVSKIARQTGAFAAINGGFFDSLGPPLGLLVVDGEWVKAPLFARAVLGMTRDGQSAIRRAGFSGRADFAGLGSLPLEGINQGHSDPDGVVAYTQRWGTTVDGAAGCARLVVGPDGEPTQLLAKGEPAPIPAGGFVLSGKGRRAATLATICPGTRTSLSLETDPPWPGLWQAVGGGPLLVQAGQVNVTAGEERFRPDVTGGARPRSAVGLTATGDLLLLAVQKPGLTLSELAGAMLKLGARDAMNLDGGGSTTLVVEGRVLNTPGDGYERAVSNALVVLRRKSAGDGEGAVRRLGE